MDKDTGHEGVVSVVGPWKEKTGEEYECEPNKDPDEVGHELFKKGESLLIKRLSLLINEGKESAWRKIKCVAATLCVAQKGSSSSSS